jgi:hypothetical protein
MRKPLTPVPEALSPDPVVNGTHPHVTVRVWFALPKNGALYTINLLLEQCVRFTEDPDP